MIHKHDWRLTGNQANYLHGELMDPRPVRVLLDPVRAAEARGVYQRRLLHRGPPLDLRVLL